MTYIIAGFKIFSVFSIIRISKKNLLKTKVKRITKILSEEILSKPNIHSLDEHSFFGEFKKFQPTCNLDELSKFNFVLRAIKQTKLTINGTWRLLLKLLV